MDKATNRLSRRSILRLGLSVPPLLLASCSAPLVTAPAATRAAQPTIEPVAETALLPATPACDAGGHDPTPAQTAGPYFTPNSPERTSLLKPDITGTTLRLTGAVLTTACQPVAQALLDFWHCDATGAYDNVGYKLRGHLFSDDNGRYQLETIQPGIYPGRTRHIHVKVQAPNQPVLTTQLYFPDEPGNAADGIFRPELVMSLQKQDEGLDGAFDFVLNLA